MTIWRIHNRPSYQLGVLAERLEARHVCVIEAQRYPARKIPYRSQKKAGDSNYIVGALLLDIKAIQQSGRSVYNHDG